MQQFLLSIRDHFDYPWLQVKHIVVVGHSSCGGIRALMTLDDFTKYLSSQDWWYLSRFPFRMQALFDNAIVGFLVWGVTSWLEDNGSLLMDLYTLMAGTLWETGWKLDFQPRRRWNSSTPNYHLMNKWACARRCQSFPSYTRVLYDIKNNLWTLDLWFSILNLFMSCNPSNI